MACGCTSACGCDVQGDGTTADVVRQGDKFVVSARRLIESVADGACVALVIDDDAILSGSVILSPDPTSVELTCTVDGLEARVVVDPASTAIVSEGPDGLRVDVPAPAEGSIGPQPGDLIFFEGVGTRPGAIDADGSPVSRAAYDALHDAVSLYATDADRIVGDDVITGIPSTRFIAPGMPLEATGFPFGTTVAAVIGSTSIQASAPADNSGGDTEVRVYPHGNGDGVSTFNTPNASRRYARGYDYDAGDLELGALGGGSTTLSSANLPLHDHPASAVVTDPGHDHGASGSDAGHVHGIASAGAHNHEPGTARDSEFVTVDDPLVGGDFVSVATLAGTTATDSVSIPTYGGAGAYAQGNRSFTSTDGTHDHGGATGTGFASISVDVVPAATGISVAVDVGDAGSATPDAFEVDPDHIVGRWMVVV